MAAHGGCLAPWQLSSQACGAAASCGGIRLNWLGLFAGPQVQFGSFLDRCEHFDLDFDPKLLSQKMHGHGRNDSHKSKARFRPVCFRVVGSDTHALLVSFP